MAPLKCASVWTDGKQALMDAARANLAALIVNNMHQPEQRKLTLTTEQYLTLLEQFHGLELSAEFIAEMNNVFKSGKGVLFGSDWSLTLVTDPDLRAKSFPTLVRGPASYFALHNTRTYGSGMLVIALSRNPIIHAEPILC